ncbi:response regulator [uncultured Piscinibacter sp.]|uniref:response regulator transcription factor n=1 Tax=uncultured Piscinibacter sp. TaxID=1131835 RepID=UPI00260883AF|nr:response regulator [uncultured Piscinibacter sp.]
MCECTPLIAVVDDERSVRKALERLLRSVGYRVEVFESGREFLGSLRISVPDCIVLDLHLQGMTGYEVQAQMAQEGVRVPVIIITGHDTPESRQRAMGQGAIAYLSKPMDDVLLVGAIASALAASRGASKSDAPERRDP